MQALMRPWGHLHYRIDGAADGPTVVFANSLGTDLRLWDVLLPFLPSRFRVIRFDKRGHGLSDLGGAALIEDYADDAIALIEATASAPVIFVGLSIGGLIAQAVAAKRPDLVCALVISNSAAKLGTAEGWQTRINAVIDAGLGSIVDAVMERWFAPNFRATPELALWRNMMLRTAPRGYTAACAALARADQTEATRRLSLPSLVIAGSEDGASPPEVVQATAALIRGADYRLLAGVGHLPCVEDPAAYAAALVPFLETHL